MWVPSHTGITGNKNVDTIANKANTSPTTTPINTLLFKNINKHTSNKWKISWEEISITNKLKEIKKNI